MSRTRSGYRAAPFDVTEGNAPFAQIVGRKLQRDLVTGNDANVVLAHLPRAVGNELVAVVERDAIARVGQHFVHDAIHLKNFFLGHDHALSESWKEKPAGGRALQKELRNGPKTPAPPPPRP